MVFSGLNKETGNTATGEVFPCGRRCSKLHQELRRCGGLFRLTFEFAQKGECAFCLFAGRVIPAFAAVGELVAFFGNFNAADIVTGGALQDAQLADGFVLCAWKDTPLTVSKGADFGCG